MKAFIERIQAMLSAANTYALSIVHYSVHDLFRIVFGLVLLTVLFWDDQASLLMARFVLGFIVTITLINHVCRRLLFPTLDLREFFKAVLEDKNVAAAIVILSICILLSAMFYVGAMFYNVAR